MVSIYALISKMRMASHADVVENAEAVIRTILDTYSRPNKTFPELQDLMLNREFVDPLLNFSEICRDELRDLPSRKAAWADQRGASLDRCRSVLRTSFWLRERPSTNLSSKSIAH